MPSPLGAPDLDTVIVRENVEGEYSEIGGRAYRGRPEEVAVQQAFFTRVGVERVARYAAELAARRTGRLERVPHMDSGWAAVGRSCA